MVLRVPAHFCLGHGIMDPPVIQYEYSYSTFKLFLRTVPVRVIFLPTEIERDFPSGPIIPGLDACND